MSRVWLIAGVMLIALSAFALYRVKYEVQNVRQRIATLQQEMERERETLNVVAAEWAYLNRPERLRAMQSRYLQQQPIEVSQIVANTELSARVDSGLVTVRYSDGGRR